MMSTYGLRAGLPAIDVNPIAPPGVADMFSTVLVCLMWAGASVRWWHC
ncbi:hypothetical protein [Actinomyces faecalis]|nr:hypothetical protein [Actinomyces faecalis]